MSRRRGDSAALTAPALPQAHGGTGALADLRDELRTLRHVVRARGLRKVALDVVEAFGRNRLLTYASAMAYQVLFALVPALLATLALLGFLHLGEVWRHSLAPDLHKRTSEAGFTVIDQTVRKVLGGKQGFWLTFGTVLAVWEISGAVRATMGALDDVYHSRDKRTWKARTAVSIALAVAVAVLALGAAVAGQFAVQLGRRVGAGPAGVIALHLCGWAVAVALLGVAVWLILRYGPSTRRPASLVSLTALVVVTLWLLGSLAFGLYATRIASYGSIFGSLAFTIILMTYLYLSALAFLVGVQLDGYLRDVDATRG